MNRDWIVTHRRADGLPHLTIAGRLHDVDAGTLAKTLDAHARDAAPAETWCAALRPLRGAFAIVMSDPGRDCLIAARDHLGLHPLFYADGAEGEVHCANAIGALLAQSGVSSQLNRAVLAEHLMHRWIDPAETYYTAIRRLPPGHLLEIRNGRSTLHRYWNPRDAAGRLDDEAAMARFDDTFAHAVERAAGRNRSAIFLSGGFDSVSVAAVATAAAAAAKRTAPYALSLAFGHQDCDESSVQTAVARQLGIEQTLIPFESAVGERGVLQAAIDIGAGWPMPLLNLWMPAYDHLARRVRPPECETILTGTGGDEWMNVTPLLAADLIKGGKMADLARLVGVYRRSFSMTLPRALRTTLWTCGGRLLASEALSVIAPSAWHRERHRKLVRSMPRWLAPDRVLRQEIEARAEQMIKPAGPGPRGFYDRELQTSLSHSLVSIELEEHFEFGRRLGVAVAHPYLDTDLVELLYGLSPAALTRGGRTKGLVRQAIATRFPGLGFERQKKVDATNFFRTLLVREGTQAWRKAGAPIALATLGIVDDQQLTARIASLLTGKAADQKQDHLIWGALNLESWVRSR